MQSDSRRMLSSSRSPSRNSGRTYPSSRGTGPRPHVHRQVGAEIVSILTFGLAVFVAACIVTYDANDPSSFGLGNAVILNVCGVVGAEVASILLHGFGVVAFLIPIALLTIAANGFKKETWAKTLGFVGGLTFAALSMSVFLSLQYKIFNFSGSSLLTGGIIGTSLSELLQKPLKSFGASVFSLLIFALALVVSTPVKISDWMGIATRFIARTTWRFSRWTATYVATFSSFLIMKLAHKLGDGFQRAVESGLKKVKEKKTAQRLNSSFSAEEDDHEDPALFSDESEEYKELPPQTSATSKAALLPMIDGMEEEEEDEIDISRLRDLEPEILPPAVKADSDEKSKKRKPARNHGAWKLPTTEFLKKPPKIETLVDRNKLIENSHILTQKLADFGIEGEITAVRPGPVITLYEFKPGPGIKVSRIAALADDLSMALSAQSVRILAPLPGKSVVGIEIPSDNRETVFLREFLQANDFFGEKFNIPVAMGKDIGGQAIFADLARMPHLLCAGQTGSGKSVFMNSLICSLLYRFTPDDLRLILVDPKFIEFRGYQEIPHLLLPVVDNPKQAAIALRWAVKEMERRYKILALMGVRNLASYNSKVEEMGNAVVHDLLFSEDSQNEGTLSFANGSDWVESFDRDDNGSPKVGKLPNIVVIIDELADLMMVARKEVEISIARIAQKARAAGIHLVVATQRPSTDVITGLIKANLPSRVSFALASHVDSKTILDRTGAEKLLGQGDMLFIPPGTFALQRLHSAYVSDDEIEKITSFLKSQGEPLYRQEILEDEGDEDEIDGGEMGREHEQDELYDQAVELVKRSGHASASFLQRHMRIGYNRAARLIELMEERGLVGPADGARPREVLVR